MKSQIIRIMDRNRVAGLCEIPAIFDRYKINNAMSLG